jgi:hypothetical protein
MNVTAGRPAAQGISEPGAGGFSAGGTVLDASGRVGGQSGAPHAAPAARPAQAVHSARQHAGVGWAMPTVPNTFAPRPRDVCNAGRWAEPTLLVGPTAFDEFVDEPLDLPSASAGGPWSTSWTCQYVTRPPTPGSSPARTAGARAPSAPRRGRPRRSRTPRTPAGAAATRATARRGRPAPPGCAGRSARRSRPELDRQRPRVGLPRQPELGRPVVEQRLGEPAPVVVPGTEKQDALLGRHKSGIVGWGASPVSGHSVVELSCSARRDCVADPSCWPTAPRWHGRLAHARASTHDRPGSPGHGSARQRQHGRDAHATGEHPALVHRPYALRSRPTRLASRRGDH